MTIVTKPISGDRKDDKDKEALVKETSNDVSVPMSDSEVEIEPRTRRQELKLLTCASHSCLLIAAAIALTIGFFGAFHVYRSMTGHSYLRGYCRLPYTRSQEDTLITGDFGNRMQSDDLVFDNVGDDEALDGHAIKPFTKVVRPELVERLQMDAKINKNGGLELDYELDLDLEEFETLQLPEISHGKYLHDFKMNKTAIIDPDGSRCFVMPLNRDEISPPRSLMEIISKLKNGAFELDLDEIRHETKVVLPPLETLEGYGFFIERACTGYKTYRLEEVSPTRIIVKRSTGEPLSGFVEYAGKALIKYNIVNLEDIEKN